MPRKKRARLEGNVSQTNPNQPPLNERVQAAFLSYRQELDEKQALHEKIFKLNRELTIASKQVICLLHRITVHSPEDREAKLAEAEAKLQELRVEKLAAIAEETKDSDQHARTFSGGVQEYIEALTFYHFLKGEVIPNRASAGSFCSTEEGPHFPLSTSDYVLGLADLSGELMRAATMAAAAGNRDFPGRLLEVLQEMAAAFQLLDAGVSVTFARQKMQAMRRSVCKVERLCYSMHVRGEVTLPSHLVAAVTEAGDSGPE